MTTTAINAATNTTVNTLLESANHLPNETQIQALLDQGFCVLDNACTPVLFAALQQEYQQLQSEFEQALIGKNTTGKTTDGTAASNITKKAASSIANKTATLNQNIRRDVTRWLLQDDIAGSQYLSLLEKLAQHLNQHFYSGIRHIEAHYAAYAVGDFYQLHRDNFNQQSNSHLPKWTSDDSTHHLTGAKPRVFSTVLYLNEIWQPDWHGELRLEDQQLQWQKILPIPNRLVIFQSNLLHEVCTATHERRSIAGWLRCDDAVLIE